MVQKIPTDNVTAHAVSVDPATGNVVVPIKAKGILVYSMTANATTTTTASSPSASSTSGAAVNYGTGMVGMIAAALAMAFWL